MRQRRAIETGPGQIVVGARNGLGIASLRSRGRAARRAAGGAGACIGDSRPCTTDFGTVLPISLVAVVTGDLFDDVDLVVQSGRHDGTATASVVATARTP